MCCSLVVLVCYPSFVVVVFFESVLVCILYPLFYVLFNMTGNPVLGDGYRERKKKIIYIRGDVVTRYNAV